MDTLTLEIQLLLCLMQVLFSVDPVVPSVGLLILFLPTTHPIGIVLHILVYSIFLSIYAKSC